LNVDTAYCCERFAATGAALAEGVGPGRERDRLGLHPVLLKGEVQAAHRVRDQRVEHSCRREQDGTVVGRRFHPEGPEHDPLAVSIIEQRSRLVVQRVRVAEHAPRVRVGTVQQRVVHVDQPDL
jgi:hypothetical protein